MAAPFVHRLRVRYHECDAQGIVFNANWLAYADVALTELWRAAMGSYAAMTDLGVDVVVAEAALRFRRPGRFDDWLDLAVAVTAFEETEIHLRTQAHRGDELLVVVQARYVVVDHVALTRTALPPAVREALQPFAVRN